MSTVVVVAIAGVLGGLVGFCAGFLESKVRPTDLGYHIGEGALSWAVIGFILANRPQFWGAALLGAVLGISFNVYKLLKMAADQTEVVILLLSGILHGMTFMPACFALAPYLTSLLSPQ